MEQENLDQFSASKVKKDTIAQKAHNGFNEQSEPNLQDSIQNLTERGSGAPRRKSSIRGQNYLEGIEGPSRDESRLDDKAQPLTVNVEAKSEEQPKDAPAAKPKKPKKAAPKRSGCCELYTFRSKKHKCYCAVGIVAALFQGALLPGFGIMFGTLLNEAFQSDNGFEIVSYVFFGIGAAQYILSLATSSVWLVLAEHISSFYRRSYFEAILRQDMAWFDQNDPQQLATKISQKCTAIEGAVGEKTALTMTSISTVVVGIGVGIGYGWQLALVLIAFGPVVVIILDRMMKKVTQFHINNHVSYIQAGGRVQQALSSIRTVLSFDNVTFEKKEYGDLLQASFKSARKMSCMTSIVMGLFIASIFFNYALGFWVGSEFVQSGVTATNGEKYNSGTVTVCFFASMMGVFSLSAITTSISPINQARIAAYQILELIKRKPAIDYHSYRKELSQSRLQGKVEFKNLSFAYPTRPNIDVLKNVSILFEKGLTTAIVGHTGSGKSTIVTLIERLYEPTQGDIYLDDEPLTSHNMKNVRSQVGYVGQEPVLYNLSIKENILFGSSNPEKITNADIEGALRAANAWHFVNKLEKGVETTIGQAGITLSGGQKQRIAIARAIINKPKILLLDEATSALDLESEKIVQEALERISLGITTIVIAHRLSTIVNADRIYVLDNGEVSEVGSHQQLLANGGKYSELFQKQVEVDSLNIELLKKKSSQHMELDQPELTKQASSKVPEQIIEEEQAELEKKLRIIAEEKARKKKEAQELKEEQAFYLSKYPFCTIARRLGGLVKQIKCYIVFGMIITLVYGCLYPSMALVLATMMITLGRGEYDTSDIMSYLFLILAVAAFGIIFCFNHFFDIIALYVTKQMRQVTYDSVLRKEVGWHDNSKNSAGSIAGLLASETTKINSSIGRGVGNFLTFLMSVALGSIISIIGEWHIGLVMVALSPLLYISAFLRNQQIHRVLFGKASKFSEASGLVSEAVVSMKTVRSMSGEEKLTKMYKDLVDVPYRAGIKEAKCNACLQAFSHAILYFVLGIGFIVGNAMAQQGWIKKREDIFIPVFAIMFASFGSHGALGFAREIKGGHQASISMFKILDHASVIDPLSTKGRTLDNPKGCVEFKNVYFKYPTRPEPVLKDLNLRIEAGQRVALVGASGCGKSTIIQLVARFYDPDQGEITLDGVSLKDLNISDLRRAMSIVQQEPLLFNTTIKKNILYGKQDATQEEIEKAAEDANAAAFIQGEEVIMADEKLPEEKKQNLGYERPVGPKGTHLSGGQKQRVAIARAIIGNPKLLMLDEATSALDKKSEEIVQKALDRVMQGRTSIVVAHRLSTIESADVIHVIHDGKVVESGKHQELLHNKGQYFKLYSQGISMM